MKIYKKFGIKLLFSNDIFKYVMNNHQGIFCCSIKGLKVGTISIYKKTKCLAAQAKAEGYCSFAFCLILSTVWM